MNIRFLITAAVAAISISVFAQGKPPTGTQGKAGGQKFGGPGGGGMGMRRGMMNEELKKQLALTPAQETKLKAISDKYRAKFPKFTPGQRPSEADMAKMKPIFDAMRKEMDAVYTPKQKETMKKWREAHPRRGMGGPGGPGGKPGVKTGKGGG